MNVEATVEVIATVITTSYTKAINTINNFIIYNFTIYLFIIYILSLINPFYVAPSFLLSSVGTKMKLHVKPNISINLKIKKIFLVETV